MAIDRLGAGILCFFAGAFFTLGLIRVIESDVTQARISPREGTKPAVMRLYRAGSDSILIQDTKDPERFLPPYNQYLNQFTNRADKIIERESIKKTVGWYD